MKGYTIVDCNAVEPHIKFLRIIPTDLKLTLKHKDIAVLDDHITEFSEEEIIV